MKLNQDQQYEIAKHVQDTYVDYSDRLTSWKERMTDIFNEYSTFKNPSKDRWTPDFKVNKAHEIVDKAVAKTMSWAPTWLVSDTNKQIEDEEAQQKAKDEALGVKAYLTEIYNKQDMIETAELVAKSMFVYGLCISKISYKYKVSRNKGKKDEITDTEEWSYTESVNSVEEDVYDSYPCIDPKSWTDVVFDPRYTRLEDFPCIIETNKNIRLSFFTKDRSRFMNVDKLIECCMATTNNQSDDRWYRSQIESILGISWVDNPSKFSSSSLNIKCYYGYYDLSSAEDWSGEKMYEFWTVNNMIVIYAEEITHMPFEDARCSYDTESFLAVWLVEPMMGLQKEMNFQKTSAAKYINQTLNRQMVRSPQSGINPSKLNDPIIIAQNGWAAAQENLYELPHRQLSSDYFGNLQDQERQIQAVTFSVDTANTKSTWALTNTATGAKIDYAESNVVSDAHKKHFEQWFIRSAYKILQVAADKMEWIISIKLEDWRVVDMRKETFINAANRFNISIEIWSTWWDSQQSKRDDAAAVANIAWVYMGMWFQWFDLEYLAKQNLWLFEQIDVKKLIKPQLPMWEMWWLMWQQQLPPPV